MSWRPAALVGMLAAACSDPTAMESSLNAPSNDDDAGTSSTPATTSSGSTADSDDDTDATTGERPAATSVDDGDSDDAGPPVFFDVAGVNGTGEESGQDCQGDSVTLQATIRDFGSSHPDFESFWGSEPTLGLVLSALGGDQTPQYNPVVPSPPAGSSPTMITSAETFAQWFSDVDGINVPVAIDIELQEESRGVFVFDDATFFPVDDAGFNAAPGPNNETFPDALGNEHNFHFTTEIHTSFEYNPGQIFTFIGDDDLWVFVDGALVIDLGGLHGEREGSVDMDTLNLTAGTNYAMDIFHAERRHDGSHFRIETSIECFLPPAG